MLTPWKSVTLEEINFADCQCTRAWVGVGCCARMPEAWQVPIVGDGIFTAPEPTSGLNLILCQQRRWRAQLIITA